MRSFDIVIIGGGPAGFAAAMSARNTYPDKSVALVRKEEVALIPCGIPYTMHRLGAVEDDILPDAPLTKAGVHILIGEVETRDGKTLLLAGGDCIAFDRLVIATGSAPLSTSETASSSTSTPAPLSLASSQSETVQRRTTSSPASAGPSCWRRRPLPRAAWQARICTPSRP